MDNPQPQLLLENIKITVTVQQCMARFQAKGSNQTIDRLTNSVTARSQDLVVPGRHDG
jgi:hypothetical protein